MAEKPNTRRNPIVRRQPQFHFTHTIEMFEFAEQTRKKESLDRSSFARKVFNAGLTAMYGVNVFDNKPDKEAA